MLSHVLIIISAIAFAQQPATKPAETTDAVLFEGKLIGIRLSRPPRDPPPDQWRVELQFQLIEGYCLTVPPMDDNRPVTERLSKTITIDLDAINPENYDEVVRQAVLPADVVLGCRCMVEGSWVMTDRNLVSAERSTPESKRAFLSRHMPAVIEREQSLARARDASRDVELSVERLVKLTAEHKADAGAPAAALDAMKMTAVIERQQQWTSARTHAEAYILMARRRAEFSREVVRLVRDSATPEQRTILDDLAASAATDLAELDRTQAQLPAQPW